MIVKVQLCMNTQYFRCPAKVGRNVRRLQREFDQWLYNRENPHPYWEVFHTYEDGTEEYGVNFDTSAFIYWLNNVRFKKGKNVARLIETPTGRVKKRIHF